MTFFKTSAARIAAALSVAALLSACAPSSYLVRTPSPSGMAGTAQVPAGASLTVVDQRKGAERDFSTGTRCCWPSSACRWMYAM